MCCMGVLDHIGKGNLLFDPVSHLYLKRSLHLVKALKGSQGAGCRSQPTADLSAALVARAGGLAVRTASIVHCKLQYWSLQ